MTDTNERVRLNFVIRKQIVTKISNYCDENDITISNFLREVVIEKLKKIKENK